MYLSVLLSSASPAAAEDLWPPERAKKSLACLSQQPDANQDDSDWKEKTPWDDCVLYLCYLEVCCQASQNARIFSSKVSSPTGTSSDRDGRHEGSMASNRDGRGIDKNS
jgi:hypothetical protein